ncbi:MAG: Uma2 family endonuclease [Bacteroidota bacterium]
MDSLQQLNPNQKYTYEDYLTWTFPERVELFWGKVVKMSPAPNRRHQDITGEIFFALKLFLKDKSGQVFVAPFDVRLPLPSDRQTDEKISTVVQPDITVVCDEKKLDKQGCNGVPDIVVEVLSPGNTKKEMKGKLKIYESAGIPEYWLVDPERAFALIYALNSKGKYVGSTPFTDEDVLTSDVLKGFELSMDIIF